ncbi:AGC family protein kinase [Histomonas meleagridis]|uniref:AGC family protein kinase n=1 Tax=Histomonas meleagridis TaxID=135588 RepID=UPI0035598A6F|nr:AGC family protein kinase [Histomonas meleagridis]KAH0806616.1 AGC family protein kinase [Histomonas meleagridis]
MRFAFQTASKFYIGMDYVPGGDLFFHLKKNGAFPIESARVIIAEVSLAIEYLHEKGIIYRDIKPENILLDADGNIKLTDFGLSKELKFGEDVTDTFCGTPDYYAPEVVQHQNYGMAIDWWSIGILSYEILFRKSPFHHKNVDKMYKNILNNEPTFPEGTDQVTIDFISRLLTKDPSKRAGFEEISHHPFFAGMDFDDVLMKRIQSGFKPELSSNIDYSCFDNEFTQETPSDSFVAPVIGSVGNVTDFSCAWVPSESPSDMGSPILRNNVSSLGQNHTILEDSPVAHTNK